GEVRARAASRPSVARVVAVTRGRTVVVTPDPTGNDSPARLAFAPAGKNTEGFAEFRRARDGAVMVRIPEGEFTMGNLETEGKPLPHPAYVSAFLMDKLPVTWKLFKRFAAATGRPCRRHRSGASTTTTRWLTCGGTRRGRTASGRARGSRRRRRGRRQRGGPTPASSRGGTRSRLPNAGSSGASGATPATTRSASVRQAPVLMVSSTPEGTCGSGA